MNNSADLRNKAILFGCVAGLLLLTSLLWIVTRPAQSFYLMRNVNNIFISNNDSRRLSAAIRQKPRENTSGLNFFGYWYSMHNSTNNMCVFAVFHDGIMVPLGAIVSPESKVIEIIPLSAHAAQISEALPESILQKYIARIEGNR